ncbi:ATPase family AAA domain-containing protein 2-like isoform X1 [Dermacentor variabilis]|uniref:ATPase family AAA domain-containing protein 2-like isoform X1 n=1 Tax=Dermacentor variabilis TaxID=34621 RepID=UPI003F5C06BF
MVKTRNKSSAAEPPPRIATRRSTKAEVTESHNSEESVDDEDKRRSSRRLKFSDDESSARLTQSVRGHVHQNHLLPNGRAHSSLRRREPPPPPNNVAVSTDDDMNEDDDSMVRRSTRRRKCIYGNLNQTWILTSSLPDFSKSPTNQSGAGNKKDPTAFHHYLRSSASHHHNSMPPGGNDSETLDGDNEDSLESKRSNEKGVNAELRRLGLSEMQHFSADDMYSRVKRTRQQHQAAAAAAEEQPFFRTRSSRRAAAEERRGRRREAAAAAGVAASDSEPRGGSSGVSGDSDVDDEEEEVQLPVMNGYHLRPKKPVTERFQVPVAETKRSKRIASIFHTPKHDRRNRSSYHSPAHRSPMYRRKRHATHNSSSTSSSSDDERRFERRKARSMVRARNRCLPFNFQEKDLFEGVLRDRAKIGSSLADVDPMHVDKEVMFDRVGGLDSHIRQLKEMILFPLIYPEVFERFKITPPRGVLFYGPPGTGKTLVARALANECARGDSRVAFFMRKGADCLSKWVGESERQLRLLFDQAYSMRPSIIFFDEIDGLAPVRSTRQDQIHSSIVSTLLALMDGLDSRGEVVVIGATNRIDAIDPALRRPGRFDREFHFSLPCHKARLSILQIHTRDWHPAPSQALLSELAARCTGYCGADLKALCSEAALVALRRSFPQIYATKEKLQLNIDTVQILPEDYDRAMRKIVPASQRCGASPARPLSTTVRPLLCQLVEKALVYLQNAFAAGLHKSSIAQRLTGQDGNQSDDSSVVSDDEAMNGVCNSAVDLTEQVAATKSIIPSIRSRFAASRSASHRPRLLICGRPGLGQTTHVAPAVLHLLEHLPLHRLDLPSLHSVTARAPEEACAQVLQEAQRVLPGVLYLPHVCQWWETLGDAVRATFLTLLSDLEPLTPVLWLATADVPFNQLPPQVQQLFGPSEVLEMVPPTEAERRSFFAPVFTKAATPPRPKRPPPEQMPALPAAPPPEPRKLTPSELERLRQQEEATLRELRLFLRDILTKLMRDRRYSMFAKPVDALEVPDYLEVIKQPMDMETMMVKIDLHQYQTVAQFLQDIELICSNALEYNPDRNPTDKNIRHRACALQDAANALVDTELDWGFEKICQDIVQARKERGEEPVPYVPKNYHVAPRPAPGNSDAPVPDLPQPEASNEEAGPKRFSRRLRGMVVVASDEEDAAENGMADSAAGDKTEVPPPTQTTAAQDGAVEVPDASTPDSQSSSMPSSNSKVCGWCPGGETSGGDRRAYPVVRRRKSLWFGSYRRHVTRHAAAALPGRRKTPAVIDKVAPRTSAKRRRSSSDGTGKNCNTPQPAAKIAAKDKSPSTETRQAATPTGSKKVGPDAAESSRSPQEKVARVEESEADDVTEDASSVEEPTTMAQVLQLNRGWLEELEDRTVNQTEGATVEQLERLYCALLNVVRRHRRSWDRNVMLLEMAQQLDSFKNLLSCQTRT